MTAHKPGDPTTINRLYGRAKGKPLRAGQRVLVDSLLPQIAVPPEGPVTAERLFGHDCPLHFEIGFGGGEHMAARADMLPNHGFIGAEPFLNGVAKLAHAARDLPNLRIHHGDARDVLEALPDACLDTVFLLFPDPWPKARHNKRRFVSQANLGQIARVLKPGGVFRVASDIADYVRWTLVEIARFNRARGHSFAFEARSAADWSARPPGWPPTRYEAKAIAAGRAPAYLRFRRV